MKTRKELKENIELKTKEEYYNWFEKSQGEYCIEPFPHRPFYHEVAKEEDYELDRRRLFSYITFFPWPEEISPKDIVKIKTELGNYEFKAPWVKENITSEDSLCIWNFSLHYSTDPKVWEWDWQRMIDRKGKNIYGNWIGKYFPPSSQLDIRISGGNRELEILRKEALKYNIQCKLMGDGDLRVRCNKRKYILLRQILLDLSQSHSIRTLYDYEEIRDLVDDRSSYILA